MNRYRIGSIVILCLPLFAAGVALGGVLGEMGTLFSGRGTRSANNVLSQISLNTFIAILVLGVATAAWWKPHRAGRHVGPSNAGGRKTAFAAIADAVNQDPSSTQVTAEDVACVLTNVASADDPRTPTWFHNFHQYLARSFSRLRRRAGDHHAGSDPHPFSPVVLECAHTKCLNPACTSVQQGKAPSLQKEGRGTSVRVVTPTGIIHGTQELKRCPDCKASYAPNYYSTSDPATGKWTKFYFTRGYTMAAHVYLRTQRGIYWTIQALNSLHQAKYHCRVSFEGFSAWYNSTAAGQSGTNLVLDKEGAQAGAAWYLFRVLSRRITEQVEMKTPSGSSSGDLVEEEVKRRDSRLPHVSHHCKHVGCGGEVQAWREGVKDGKPLAHRTTIRHRCYVVDGNCNMKMQVCGAVQCEERPVNSKTRYCAQHAALELQCGVQLADGSYCQQPVVQLQGGRMSKACSAHQKEEQMFKDTGFHRQAQRPGRNHTDPEGDIEREESNGHMKHRFSRVYTYCVLTIACGCGVIVAYARCKHGERVMPLLELLHRVVRPSDDNPVIVVYDRACQVYKYLMPRALADGLPAHIKPFAPRPKGFTKWLVDRFHFASHKRTDDDCRKHCNPYDPQNQVFSEIVDKKLVEPTPALWRFCKDFDMSMGYKYSGQAEDGSKVKMRDYVCTERDEEGVERTFVYEIKDRFNTQVAEQSYARIENIGNLMRRMDAWNAEFYFQEMVTAHNHWITESLEQAEYAPQPLSPFCIPGACTASTHVCELLARKPLALPMNVMEVTSCSHAGWKLG